MTSTEPMTYKPELSLVLLRTEEEIRSLKKGDIVVVKWERYAREFGGGKPVTTHKFHSFINSDSEVLLDVRNNTYFIIGNYLRGQSSAREVYILKDEEQLYDQ